VWCFDRMVGQGKMCGSHLSAARVQRGTARYLTHQQNPHATLGNDALKGVCGGPAGVNRETWIAAKCCDVIDDVHTVLSLLSGGDVSGASPICAPQTCVSNGGKREEYIWRGEDGKQVNLGAAEYFAKLMMWCDRVVTDQDIFGTCPFRSMPKGAVDIIKMMFRRLSRVYVHIFLCHRPLLQKRGYEAHINYCFKHFLFFGQEYDLLGEWGCNASDLEPLRPMIVQMLQVDPTSLPAKYDVAGMNDIRCRRLALMSELAKSLV